ncbi:hypothetical protein CDEST_00669 [Colletotrichum destructivum]|uniref:Uncharacterized protein n=1 Tax=Colletotrichum destructivum TaxID=34406 RepID=A0AAX4HX43_9PEZI|nr:hypothetical protein CDEST_00669 [Colletotrichum destructivum]
MASPSAWGGEWSAGPAAAARDCVIAEIAQSVPRSSRVCAIDFFAQPPRSRQVAVSHGSLQARLTSPQKIGGFPGLCFGTAQVGQAPRTPRAETSHLGDIPGVSGFFHGLGVFDTVDPRSFVAPQSTFNKRMVLCIS